MYKMPDVFRDEIKKKVIFNLEELNTIHQITSKSHTFEKGLGKIEANEPARQLVELQTSWWYVKHTELYSDHPRF